MYRRLQTSNSLDQEHSQYSIPQLKPEVMIQQPRPEQPLYSCTIPVDKITGRQDEELIAFGGSIEEAKREAEQLLVQNYGCPAEDINCLLQNARLELLAPWCAPGNNSG